MLKTRITSLFLSLFVMIFLITGCKDSGSGSGGGIPTTGSITATVDGNSWEGNGGSGFKQTSSYAGVTVTTVTVVAAKVLDVNTGDNETIEVTVYGEEGASSIAETSYDVESDEVPTAQFSFTIFQNNVRTSYFATSGTVEITSFSDTEVQGTFSGIVTNVDDENDTKEITGGGFNITLQSFGF